MQKLPLEPIVAITFDMYGTLLDLVASFAPGFEVFMKSKGYLGRADEVVRAWEIAYLHETNVDSLLGRPRTPFEVIRRFTLSALFSKLKISHTKGRHRRVGHDHGYADFIPRCDRNSDTTTGKIPHGRLIKRRS